jgi:serine/threonine-protein kinase
LSGRRKLLGDSSPAVGGSLRDLGILKQRRGETEEAERLLRQSLAIARASGPEGHEETALVLRHLGEVLSQRGKAAEAEPLLREALAIHGTARQPEHSGRSDRRPESAAILRSLGYSLVLQARYSEAEPLLLQAYRDLSEGSDYWSGKDQRETGRRLAELYRRQGRPGEAAKYQGPIP